MGLISLKVEAILTRPTPDHDPEPKKKENRTKKNKK